MCVTRIRSRVCSSTMFADERRNMMILIVNVFMASAIMMLPTLTFFFHTRESVAKSAFLKKMYIRRGMRCTYRQHKPFKYLDKKWKL